MRMIPLNKEGRQQARKFYIREGARPITTDGCSSIVYYYESAGRLYAQAFRGTAAKPSWHYAFRTEQQREDYAQNWLRNEQQSIQRTADRQAKAAEARANFINPYKVGDILHSSWGYDQTNVEFFQVVEVGARSITIREISASCVETGFMSGTVTAQPDKFIGEPIRRTIQIGVSYDGKVHHSVCSPIHGHLYTGGNSQHCSWYA